MKPILDPMYHRVVKIYKLHKKIIANESIPFMLAYTRGINDDYKSTGYCDRVDIDIMNAIHSKYPDTGNPETIVMHTIQVIERVKHMTTGFHFNAEIHFVNEVTMANGRPMVPTPHRKDVILSLYVEDETYLNWFKNELTIFTLPGGDMNDYVVEEDKNPVEKLSFHPLMNHISIYYKEINDFLLVYDDCTTWDNVVMVHFLNDTHKTMMGKEVETRSVMSKLLTECKTDNAWRRVGAHSNEHHLYTHLYNVITDTLKDEKENDIKTIRAELERIMEI